MLKPDAGSPPAFRVPTHVSPSLARAYLRARMRCPLSREVDVSVVLDKDGTPIAHGSPTDWPAGLGDRVIAGEVTLGTLRIRRHGFSAAHDSLRPAGQRPSAARPGRTGLSPGVRWVAKLKFGVSSDRGGCSYMEDAHVVHAPAGADFALGCVYDGHGGSFASQFCRERLHFNVMGSAAFVEGDAQTALRDGFLKTENDLLAEQREMARRAGATAERRSAAATGEGGEAAERSAESVGSSEASSEVGEATVHSCCGSTALVVLVRPDGLHVAWAGDCRAVLCRAGGAVALTRDHSVASCDEEVTRVVAAGGWVEGGRLGGFLEVARALGDLDSATASKPLGLSGEPELRSEALTPEDEFVLLGSDGLWGVISSEDAVRIAREELLAYGDAGMASEKLVEVALKRHADDNISAMVVCLNPIPVPAMIEERPARRRLQLQKPSAAAASM